MTTEMISLPLVAAFAFFAARRLLRYLHIFQQDAYDAARFSRWIVYTLSFDKRLSAAILAVCIAEGAAGLPHEAAALAIAALFAGFAALEPNPLKAAKKKLAMTNRARRIFALALVLCLAVSAGAVAYSLSLAWFLAAQAVPLTLVLSNAALVPVEAFIQQRIMREASRRLAQVSPQVIGVTGSFGKTSVKHILGHALEMNAETLFTPGSVNTLMGISRIIRERLRQGTRYFLVEMGAYGKGSIAKLCRFTPPAFGVITSIGEAHYERFKTLDNVARAKFELAEAVLKNGGGKVVVHESVAEQPYAAEFIARNRSRFIVCGRGEGADWRISEAGQTDKGINLRLFMGRRQFDLFAPLYGEHHADNMALAFAAAVALGIDPDRAAAAIRTTPQIEHRLEVKPQAGGITYIDDAFNSNPRGFSAALAILARLGASSGGRRVLVTPGMVELGARHDDLHRKAGEEAAAASDIVLAVKSERIPTFVDGFKSRAAPKQELIRVGCFAEARGWLDKNIRSGDVVLLENDLPDLDEARLKL